MVPSVVSIDAGGHRRVVLARRDALVLAHLDLVPPIARRILAHLPPSFDLEDLISVGNFGLLRAATRFRPRTHGGRATPFAAFARPRIHGAILDSVRRRHWFEATQDEIPAHTEIAFEDRFAEDAVVSIDAGRLARKDHYGRVRNGLALALGRLTARERHVLGAYYAQNCDSMLGAGELLGLTVSQVAAEHDAALAKLRAWLKVG